MVRPSMLSTLPVLGAEPASVKLLDLLTNRYHAGVVRLSTAAGMSVELTAESPHRPSARFRAGQRVHFIVADNLSGVLSRRKMRRARVQQVQAAEDPSSLCLDLQFMDESDGL